jgi:hypothetical protein
LAASQCTEAQLAEPQGVGSQPGYQSHHAETVEPDTQTYSRDSSPEGEAISSQAVLNLVECIPALYMPLGQRPDRDTPGPVKVTLVPFQEDILSDIIRKLVTYQGNFIAPPGTESQSTAQPAASTPVIRDNNVAPGSIEVVIGDPGPSSPQAQDIHSYMKSAYPSHSAAIAALSSGTSYCEAYRLCFKMRVYNFIISDVPHESVVNAKDLQHWLGITSPKTFKNMMSRFNGATTCLQWSRKLEEDSDCFTIGVLSKLVEGELELINLQDLMDIDEVAAEKRLVEKAVSMSALALDRMIKSIKTL